MKGRFRLFMGAALFRFPSCQWRAKFTQVAKISVTCSLVALLLITLIPPRASAQKQQPEGPTLATDNDCQQPNILVIVSDDQPKESMRVMNFMQRMRGVVRFSNFYLNFGLCCPSRATIMTGLYSHHHGVENNGEGYQLDANQTIFVALDRAGYDTALIGKFMNGFPWDRGKRWVPSGLDHSLVFGGGYYDYRAFENGKVVRYGHRPEDYKTDVQIAMALDFIKSTREDPFFLIWAPEAPHAPRIPAPRDRNGFRKINYHSPAIDESDIRDKPAWVQDLPLVDLAEMRERRRGVYRTLQSVDRGIRRMFAALRRKGKLDCTVLFYLTDNGFAFGEQRWIGKRCPYDACMGSPLYVRLPSLKGRRRVAIPTSNVDIAPTIAELARASLLRKPDGRSLLPLLEDRKVRWRRGVLLRGHSYGQKAYDVYKALKQDFDFWGVRTQRWKYIEYRTGEQELYDIRRDKWELHNLVGKGYPKVTRDLARVLRKLR